MGLVYTEVLIIYFKIPVKTDKKTFTVSLKKQNVFTLNPLSPISLQLFLERVLAAGQSPWLRGGCVHALA